MCTTHEIPGCTAGRQSCNHHMIELYFALGYGVTFVHMMTYLGNPHALTVHDGWQEKARWQWQLSVIIHSRSYSQGKRDVISQRV